MSGLHEQVLRNAIGSKERTPSQEVNLDSSFDFIVPPIPLLEPNSALHCGKVSLETLARKFGTPLYVYSADQIIERLQLFQQAFAGRDHLICYAVKANSALAILKLLADRGSGFDIVIGR